MRDPSRAVSDYEPPESSRLSAVFSSVARRGDWLPPEELRVFAMFGKVTLDLTQALLAPGLTEIHAFVMFGELEVIVTPELEVELAANAVLGSVERREGVSSMKALLREGLRRVTGAPPLPERELDDDDDPPLLRIDGQALFGAIKVRVR